MKTLYRIEELNYSGTIRYSGFVEPLLDKNIYNLLSMVKTYLPQSNTELVTNGDPLNLKRLKKLFEHGLNRILISSYDGKEESDKFEEMCLQANLLSHHLLLEEDIIQRTKILVLPSNRSG